MGFLTMDVDKVGEDLHVAYNEGYKQGLIDLANKMERELNKASWYSKGKILKYIKEHYGG